MDARKMVEKNKVYDHRGKKAKLLHHKTITIICLFVLTLTFISSCARYYYTDSAGEEISTEAAKHYNRANAYVHNGQYDQAIVEYTKAIELEPRLADAYFNRGLAYVKKGQYDDQAIVDFTEAIELSSGLAAPAYYYRGFCYFMKGVYGRALSDANKAAESDATYANAYLLKASVYEKMERTTEAIEAYRNFIKHTSPRNTAAIEEVKVRIAELERQQ
jgi:tetratricopeptide (TPR) repeat protein